MLKNASNHIIKTFFENNDIHLKNIIRLTTDSANMMADTNIFDTTIRHFVLNVHVTHRIYVVLYGCACKKPPVQIETFSLTAKNVYDNLRNF